MSPEGRELFVMLASSAGHLRPSDGPMLASYVETILEGRRSAAAMRAAVSGKRMDLDRYVAAFALWAKSLKLQLAIATKLRLTPQARTDPKTVGRQQPGDRLAWKWDGEKLVADEDADMPWNH